MNSAFFREAGRTPVQRNTFYEPIKVLPDCPTLPQRMKPNRRRANRRCWKVIWRRRENGARSARHINIDEAVAIGMKIVRMEENQAVQDTVLTVHHAFMHTFANSKAIKIVENQIDNAVIAIRG